MKNKTVICNLILIVFILLLGAALTYLHYTHMFYFLENTVTLAKIACLGLIMILSVRVIKPKNCTTPIKYIVLYGSAVLITLGFTLLNSLWHYIAFSTQPDFPVKVSYTGVFINDMIYNISYVIFRYVVIFICWILLFRLSESNLLKKIVEFARDKIDGFFGMPQEMEDVSADEVEQLVNTLSNAEREDYCIYKSEFDDVTVYTIEIDKD